MSIYTKLLARLKITSIFLIKRSSVFNNAAQSTDFEQQNSEIARVKMIPTEILGIIFELCIQGPVILPSPKQNRHPWNTSQVCSQWRQISQHLFPLWADIVIHSDILPNNNLVTRNNLIREILRDLLSRTTLPISLSVGGQETSMIADLISLHNHRFKKLSLNLNQQALSTLSHLPSHSFPHLESLEIQTTSLDASFFSAPNLELFQNALALRNVTGDGYIIAKMLNLPFAQLTTFHSTDIGIDWVILREGSSLVHLSFVVYIDGRHNDIIVLPKLRSLEVKSSVRTNWEAFLGSLMCPSLKRLVLTTGPCDDHFPLHALAAFISRSACCLTALGIHMAPRILDIQLTNSDFLPLSKLLPSLYEFNSSFITPPLVFEQLSNGLLPALTKCTWSVRADGINAALDFFDSQALAARLGSPRRSLDMRLHYTDYDFQFHPTHSRFQENIQEYSLLAPMCLTIFYDDIDSSGPAYSRIRWISSDNARGGEGGTDSVANLAGLPGSMHS